MAKIVFIGAGSFGFTRNLVKDVLTFPNLKNATLVLMGKGDSNFLEGDIGWKRRVLRFASEPFTG